MPPLSRKGDFASGHGCFPPTPAMSASQREAQDQATEWLGPYNNERPNMGIGGMTPAMKLKTAA